MNEPLTLQEEIMLQLFRSKYASIHLPESHTPRQQLNAYLAMSSWNAHASDDSEDEETASSEDIESDAEEDADDEEEEEEEWEQWEEKKD
jgi:hypothetical protein